MCEQNLYQWKLTDRVAVDVQMCICADVQMQLKIWQFLQITG